MSIICKITIHQEKKESDKLIFKMYRIYKSRRKRYSTKVLKLFCETKDNYTRAFRELCFCKQ